MAYIDRLWIHSGDKDKGKITAYVKLKPSGEAQVKFNVPDEFYDCLINMAQSAADLHEQQMRAEFLANNMEQTNDR